MSFRVSGKNIEVGEALRERISGRILESLEKYFDGGFSGHATVGKVPEDAIQVGGHWVVIDVELSEMCIVVAICLEPAIHVPRFSLRLEWRHLGIPSRYPVFAPRRFIMPAEIKYPKFARELLDCG